MTDRPEQTRADRRRLLTGAAVLAAYAALPGPARALEPTPRQTAGPFYPEDKPADDDWDLVRVHGRDAAALGTVAIVSGRVLDPNGRPVSGALVEIWQCDANGIYHHPRDRERGRDPGFQGYGQVRTGAEGAYRFRTIRPVPYGSRTPHVHFAVRPPGGGPLVTQMYVEGEPRNASDFLFTRLSPAEQAAVLVALTPAPEVETAALAGRFDIVLPG